LTVLSNKKVYANLNNPGIEILGRDDILDIVYKEMHKGKSWTKIRKYVTPCKSCVFNALCPPISNYEYTLGKYDLCYMSPSDIAR
jgi:pseudo-rSAM protein